MAAEKSASVLKTAATAGRACRFVDLNLICRSEEICKPRIHPPVQPFDVDLSGTNIECEELIEPSN